jgi:hypothetical protein
MIVLDYDHYAKEYCLIETEGHCQETDDFISEHPAELLPFAQRISECVGIILECEKPIKMQNFFRNNRP